MYGAVEPLTGESFILEMPDLNMGGVSDLSGGIFKKSVL